MNEQDEIPIFVISVAAALAGMHPQTLRQYDRLGLVSPGRARGRGRRYSRRDVALLREVQRLSQEDGVNLAGIKRILELERQVLELQREVTTLRGRLASGLRVFAAGPTGDVVEVRPGRRVRRAETGREPGAGGGALVLWRPHR